MLAVVVVEFSSTNWAVLASTFDKLNYAKPVKGVSTRQFASFIHTFFAYSALFLLLSVLNNRIARVNIGELESEMSEFLDFLNQLPNQFVCMLHNEYLSHGKVREIEGPATVHNNCTEDNTDYFL